TDYRPRSIRDPANGGLDLGFSYDAAGNLTQLKNGTLTAVRANYGYDTLNRLLRTNEGAGTTANETYSYDATGNRLSFAGAGATRLYTYPATSHRLSAIDGAARGYDANGNTTQVASNAREYVYSEDNRLSAARQAGVTTGTYLYNGRGEQVRRTAGVTAVFVYDENGRLLGQYTGTGVPIQQYVWMDDQPVGVVAANGTLHYVEPDHLGTPRSIIDATRQQAIWTWDLKSEAFGNTAPDTDPDADGTPFIYDLRFPGQRYDAASGLNYNYFRDYEPGTGRYIESDPIGLRGGTSTYSYVAGRPLVLIDPSGLKARVCCRQIPGLPAQHCFIQEAKDDSCIPSCKTQTRTLGLHGPPPFGDSNNRGGQTIINHGFDNPGESQCGEWTTRCNLNACLNRVFDTYPNPSAYSGTRGPNSNTFAYALTDQCAIAPPPSGWPRPGWGQEPAPRLRLPRWTW
ncbi:MAG TPA: RHS repeat-associated core domain-containing protein, partial [Hymenobacter sp.]|nr:RHS repeat-associated core domain-containing protein [Hymenobacter sp.]